MKTLSRKKNGAVHVGNTDLILPVRVRTRTEDVGRTPEAIGLWRNVASAPQETGVAKRPANVTPKGGALAWMTCEPPPFVRSTETELLARSSGGARMRCMPSGYSGGWRRHLEIRVFHQTGEVPRRLCCLRQSKTESIRHSRKDP